MEKHLAPPEPLQDTQGQSHHIFPGKGESRGAALGAAGARGRGWRKEERDGGLRRGLQGGRRGWRGGKGWKDEERDAGKGKRDAGMEKGMQERGRGCTDEEGDAGKGKGIQGWGRGCRDKEDGAAGTWMGMKG